MNLKTDIAEIKRLIEEKGEANPHPENNSEAIVVREQIIGDAYTASVGIGLIKVNESTSRYFDLTGRVFDDTMQKFSESVLRIEPQAIATTKGLNYYCSVFPVGLIRAMDEAVWAEKFTNLEDLKNVIIGLGKNDLGSMFQNLAS